MNNRWKNLKWDKLKAFYHLAKHKSFSDAAEAMNLSQPAFSRQIKDLEDCLGVTLMLRTSSGNILSEEGSLLYDSVKKIFLELESAQVAIAESKDVICGDLTIATTNALASSWLPLFVPSFLEKHPEVKVNIIGNDQELDLKTREADVLIRTQVEQDVDLFQDYLMTFHLGLYASPKYLERQGKPQSFDELKKHKLLVFGDYRILPYGNVNWILTDTMSSVPREAYMTINSSQGLHLMAEAGVGIAALSHEYASQNTKLVRVLPEVEGPTVKIYYICAQGMSEVKRVRAFLDHVKGCIQGGY